MKPSNSSIENSIQFDPHEIEESQLKIEEPQAQIEEDDEALSLCDLATIEPEIEPNESQLPQEHEEDFDFITSGATTGPENQICTADEVFFRGQILPLSGFTTQTRNLTRSRSESITTSRSSSVRSHNSATSGSMSITSGSEPRTRNHFHSHPSPTPRIRTRIFHQSKPKPSSNWSFFQLGPVKQQEIRLADLKNRSRRSNSSSGSTSSSRSSTLDQIRHSLKQKKQILLFGGCKCSVDSIENGVLMVKEMKSKEEAKKKLGISRKDGESIHRTFEWLKQLSIQESASL